MDELNEQRMHNTYKYKLKPTTEQVAAMEFVMRRCRVAVASATMPLYKSVATPGKGIVMACVRAS
jgi:hypothetical protein